MLGQVGQSVIVVRGGALEAYDAGSGEVIWSVPKPERGAHRYAARREEEAGLSIYRYDGGVFRFGPDGRPQKIADKGVDSPWAFQADATGSVATADGAAVRFYRGGREQWSFGAGGLVTAGPALHADGVLAGDQNGELVRISRTDGEVLWRKRMDGGLLGPLTAMGDAVIAASTDGDLIAVRIGDGEPLWTHHLGDVLLTAPQVMAGKLMVAAKSNRIELLDPATGELHASFEADTWLVDVGVVDDGHVQMAVCTDLSGAVTFLDSADLRPLGKAELATRLSDGVVYTTAFPSRWGTAQGLVYDEKPTVLVSDHQGFLYMLSVPGEGIGR